MGVGESEVVLLLLSVTAKWRQEASANGRRAQCRRGNGIAAGACRYTFCSALPLKFSLIDSSRYTPAFGLSSDCCSGRATHAADPKEPVAAFAARDWSTSKFDLRSRRRKSQRQRQESFASGQHRPGEDSGRTTASEGRVLTLTTPCSPRRSSG